MELNFNPPQRKQNREIFRVHEKEIISEGWHSFVDVQAMSSIGWGLKYLKKYLRKNIDAENKDSKTLKTLALGWLFNKRAFSVSGKFRQRLIDLNKTKHNSNHKTYQVALDGMVVQEYAYFFIGIVSGDVIRLKGGGWSHVLDCDQIERVEKALKYGLLDRCRRDKYVKSKKRVVKKVAGWL